MFSEAMAKAAGYTRPVIISTRHENHEIHCGMATFVVLNDLGWAVTAAHVVQNVLVAQQHDKERADYQSKVQAINANPAFTPGKKKHELNQLVRNLNWITNQSLWWSADGISFGNIYINAVADLAITQLVGPIEQLKVTNYPVLANPHPPIRQGTSLCRLGFPFHDVNALFDINSGQFSIPDLPPLAMFPNDGIMTRNILIQDPNTKANIHVIETSSAGLRGQSGGPIFDTKANVWAIQSSTNHLPLGFSPTVTVKGKQVIEHQFMHVGWGIHISHLREMLEQLKVPFQSA